MERVRHRDKGMECRLLMFCWLRGVHWGLDGAGGVVKEWVNIKQQYHVKTIVFHSLVSLFLK